MKIQLTTPLTKKKACALKAGDQVLLNGVIYTARDAAHRRLVQMIENNEPLPFVLQDAVIYYVGPTPTPPSMVFGSGGPTTSGRMDAYAPTLMAHGLRGMIGKGYRNEAVKEAILKYQGIYFGAIGGAGAIIGNAVKEAEVIAFEDLGTEAIRRLVVEDFPAVVIMDTMGNDLYEAGVAAYLAQS